MIEVNLRPGREGGEGRRARRPEGGGRLRGFSLGGNAWHTALLAAVVVVPLAMLVLWLTQRSYASDVEARLEAATADSARLADLRAVVDSLTERQTLVRERVALIERLDRNRFVWPHVMDEVSRALPTFAWLTSVQQTTPLPNLSFQIQGMAANPLVITDFVRNLQASPYIGDVRIMGSQQRDLEDVSVQSFTLVARFVQPLDGSRTAPVVSLEAGI